MNAITSQFFDRIFSPKVKAKDLHKHNLIVHRARLVAALNKFLPMYGITTYRRVCAFFANCGIETAYFKTTIEYASGADYEWRKNLGNTKKGDGRRFKGRGLTQTTGRYNYWMTLLSVLKKLSGKDYSKVYRQNEELVLAEADKYGVNFIEHPELLAQIEWAVESACIFWQQHNLNDFADQGTEKGFKSLSGIVNRGDPDLPPMHWTDRLALYKKCKAILPETLKLTNTLVVVKPQPAEPAVPAPPQPVEPQTGTVTVEPSPSGTDTTGGKIDLDALSGKYDSIADKVQRPCVKAALWRAGGSAGSLLTAIWSTTGGKVALILSALAILGVAVWIIHRYRNQIHLGWEMVKDSFRQFWKLSPEAK
ncbi:MAG TPA: hypothetical protein VF599_12570 [Pyrinomonadaceae bacterium]|jgi:predicted chitinase